MQLSNTSLYANSYTAALEEDDNNSITDTIIDVAQYGITGSIASGALGVVNTGIAFGNMLGFENEKFDTFETLSNLGLDGTANYYAENKDVLDAVGFVGSAIVPGVIGLKAAKAAQGLASASTSTSKLAVAVRAALLPKSQASRLNKAIKEDILQLPNRTQMLQTAASKGFHQAAVESFFAESVILLTTNQNPSITSEDQSYLEAIRDNLGGAAFGFALGTGFGGIIQTAMDYSTLMKMGVSKSQELNKLVGDVAVDSATNRVAHEAGDRAAFFAHKRSELMIAIDKYNKGALAGDPADVKFLQDNLEVLEDNIKDSILDMVTTFDPKTHVITNEEIASSIWQNVKNSDSIDSVDFLGNLKQIVNYTDEDALFDPTISRLSVIPEEQWGEALADVILPEQLTGELREQAVKVISNRYKNSEGLYIDTAGKGRVHIIDTLTQKGNEDRLRAVLYHEMGHANTERLTSILERNPLGVTKEMETLSRRYRPDSWKAADQLNDAEIALRRAMEEGLEQATITRLSDTVDYLRRFNNYLRSPEELMADSWALLNNKSTFHEATKDAPNVYKLFANNTAVKQRVGETEALLDTKTGDMFSVPDRSPTVGDIGNVSYDQKLHQVTFGQGNTRGKVNITNKFDVFKSTPQEASAHYYAVERQFLNGDQTFEWTNFPMMHKVLYHNRVNGYEGKITIKVDGEERVFNVVKGDATELREFYKDSKNRAISEIRNSDRSITPSNLARIVDTSEEYALSSGLTGGTSFWSDVYPTGKPSVVKLKYANRSNAGDPANVQAISDIERRIKTTQSTVKNAAMNFMYDIDSTIPDIFPKAAFETGDNIALAATKFSDGAGLVRSFQAEYGSVESWAQAVAEANGKAKGQIHKYFNDTLNKHVLRVNANETAMNEFAVLDSVLRKDKYVFAPKGDTVADMKAYFAQQVPDSDPERVFKVLQELDTKGIFNALVKNKGNGTIWGSKLTQAFTDALTSQRLTNRHIERIMDSMSNSMHHIKTPEVIDFWRTKSELNGLLIEGKRTIASIRGTSTSLTDGVLYPGPFDFSRQKYVAFVYPKRENGIFNSKKPSIISASTPEGLAAKKQQALEAFGENEIIIRTKEQIERNAKLRGEYEDQLALTDYFVDSTMINKGILSDVIPEPSEDLLRNSLVHMNKEADLIIDNLTTAMYGQEVATLEHYGKLQRSVQTGLGRGNKGAPTADQRLINIMLNRESKDSFEPWKTAQQDVDRAVSAMFNSFNSMFRSAQKIGDYEQINKFAESYGMPMPYDNKFGKFAMTNEKVPDSVLREVVPKANAFASTSLLRLDAIQWLVTAMSTPITAVPELGHLLKSIPRLRGQQVGDSLSTMIPGSGNKRMPSNMKVMMQAIKDFFTDKELVQRYDELGITPSIVREMREGIDDLALDPKLLNSKGEISKWKSRFEAVKDTVLKPSDYSESFAKFVAARSADIVLQAGGITDATIRQTAMRTYVKRVHGNYTYAQRPALFQGFAGQAIGLFQTYQFNLFQQFLRHVSDDNLKAATSMIGIQTGLFGAQSLPGFQLINNYIGERSVEGNDFYTGTTDLFGNEVAEWMLYGVASNMTKPIVGDGIALYTRGDLTPRTPILIPTSIADVPVVNFTTKFINAIGNTANNIAGDVPVDQIFYEALAMNGVNRPLAGIGQVLSGAHTTSQGTLLASTQDTEWWSQFARVLGSKSLDESLAINTFYRAKSYDTFRRDRVNKLGRRAKAMIRAGEWDASTYDNFIREYQDNGGTQEYFSQWLHDQAMGATESTISKMYEANDKPSGRYMQRLLGAEIEDYIDVDYNANQ